MEHLIEIEGDVVRYVSIRRDYSVAEPSLPFPPHRLPSPPHHSTVSITEGNYVHPIIQNHRQRIRGLGYRVRVGQLDKTNLNF